MRWELFAKWETLESIEREITKLIPKSNKVSDMNTIIDEKVIASNPNDSIYEMLILRGKYQFFSI